MRFSASLIRRAFGLVLVAVAAAGAAVTPQPAAAQTAERCFPETGFCISGPIRQYWERNGGLAVFGYPISPLRREAVEGTWAGPVQWFERDRLEDHSNAGQGVLAGRLGARSLELQGINWQEAAPDNATQQGCRLFRETGYNVCGPFLRYWEQNGGLERFGYPLGRERQETIEGRQYTVQYFERRRMELHPENAGTPFEVLLGLLGRDVFRAEGDQNIVVVPPGDIDANIQEGALNAAYASLRRDWPSLKLSVGFVDVADTYALVMAKPFLQNTVYLHLALREGVWQVVAKGSTIAPAAARQAGFPAQLLAESDRTAIIGAQLGQLQDPQGQGFTAFITRPRIAGDFARFSVQPALSENRDPAETFYRRQNGVWAFYTAGTAFPEDQLQSEGIPSELWPYSVAVNAPR